MTDKSGASHFAAALRQRLAGWGWSDVMLPYIGTRLALVITGFLASYFPIFDRYPIDEVRARGWNFSPHRSLDIWGRWDSNWYIDLALHGYSVRGDLSEVQSNVSFFPAYSYMVRGVLWLVPDAWQSSGVNLLAGVMVSNLLLIAALLLLHRLVTDLYQDRSLAQRTILYTLLYPAAFFLSAAYTESTFYFFAVATFYAAHRRAWGWAALAAGLLAVSRPLGILILAPLGWMYLESIGWRLRALRPNALWLLLAPLPFAAHLANLARVTGDWLSWVRVQQAWFRDTAWPWKTLLDPVHPNGLMTTQEQLFTILFLVGSVVALYKLPSAAYALYTLMIVVPPLFTNTMTSSSRYYVVLFPMMILLAMAGRYRSVDALIQPIFFAIQVVMMVAWSQFYWVA